MKLHEKLGRCWSIAAAVAGLAITQSAMAAPEATPDGAPTIDKNNGVVSAGTTSSTRKDAVVDGASSDAATRSDGRRDDATVSEEKVENRLAVIRSGKTTTTDPNVGRYDCAAVSGQRRVTPSMWELFRF